MCIAMIFSFNSSRMHSSGGGNETLIFCIAVLFAAASGFLSVPLITGGRKEFVPYITRLAFVGVLLYMSCEVFHAFGQMHVAFFCAFFSFLARLEHRKRSYA